MRYLVLPVLLSLPLTAYAGNIKDTDLITSNTFFLPPTTANTIFIQARNSSDNQSVSLTDLGSRLTAKGYQIIQDPSAARYILLANIVYCNVTKPEMPSRTYCRQGGMDRHRLLDHGRPARYDRHGQHGRPSGALIGTAASMGLSAIEGVGSAIGSMFSGPPTPKMPNDVNCARRRSADYGTGRHGFRSPRCETRQRRATRRLPDWSRPRRASEETR